VEAAALGIVSAEYTGRHLSIKSAINLLTLTMLPQRLRPIPNRSRPRWRLSKLSLKTTTRSDILGATGHSLNASNKLNLHSQSLATHHNTIGSKSQLPWWRSPTDYQKEKMQYSSSSQISHNIVSGFRRNQHLLLLKNDIHHFVNLCHMQNVFGLESRFWGFAITLIMKAQWNGQEIFMTMKLMKLIPDASFLAFDELMNLFSIWRKNQ